MIYQKAREFSDKLFLFVCIGSLYLRTGYFTSFLVLFAAFFLVNVCIRIATKDTTPLSR